MVSVVFPEPGAAILVGVKVMFTPVGIIPPRVNDTAELKPFLAALVKLTVPEVPGGTFSVVAEATKVKLGTSFTVNAMACVWVTSPPVMVTVAVAVLAAAEAVAVKVSRVLPSPGAAMLVGEKLAVTPAGNPLTENAIAELNDEIGTVVIETWPDPEGAIVTLVALGSTTKSGTSTMIVVTAVTLPLVALMAST